MVCVVFVLYLEFINVIVGFRLKLYSLWEKKKLSVYYNLKLNKCKLKYVIVLCFN